MASKAFVSWREIPVLRIIIPFLVGIIMAWHSEFSWFKPILTFAIPLTVLLCVVIFRPLSLSINKLVGLSILLWFLCFGYWRASIHFQKNDANHFSKAINIDRDSTYWCHAIVKEISPKSKSISVEVDIYTCGQTADQLKKQNGRLLLYIAPDSTALALKIGSKIIFNSAISEIKPPLNPGAFSFADYQAKKNIFHQAYLQSTDWFIQEENWTLRSEASLWRKYLMSILRKHLSPGSNELAVAAALILGNKDELDDDIRNAYADTGAIHVLAVSGLHVGFIAWGLTWLLSLGPLGKPSLKWIRLLLSILGVWGFALLTGLSPSVMRAACMFSFILIGQGLYRKTNIYNIIAASAFLLLLIDPFLVFNIGFQLSYLAVLGIVFFQRRIYQLLYPPNKTLDYIWNLSSVALAAQFTTMPLSLFYFHQFPVYFLLSGIVVVTSASIILGLGVLLFITSSIPFVSTLIGSILQGILWLNNAFIFALNELPGGLISGVWIGIEILIILYLAVLFLARLMQRKKSTELLLFLTCIAVALCLNVHRHFSLSQQRSITVYHQYKESVIDAFDGKSRYSLSSISEEDPVLNWSIRPRREKMSTEHCLLDSMPHRHWLEDRHFLGFYNKRLLIIDRSFELPHQEETIIVDIIVLQNAPNLSLSKLNKHIKAKHWIIDGSNPPSFAERWIKEAKGLGISVHWTATEGAFVLEF